MGKKQEQKISDDDVKKPEKAKKQALQIPKSKPKRTKRFQKTADESESLNQMPKKLIWIPYSHDEQSPSSSNQTSTTSSITRSAKFSRLNSNNPQDFRLIYSCIEDWLDKQEVGNQSEVDVLKELVRRQKVQVLKEIQIGLEMKAFITFTFVAIYLKRNDFKGLGDFFNDRCDQVLDLIMSLAEDADGRTRFAPVKVPDWLNWTQALDALHEAFQAEKDSLNNFGQLLECATDGELGSDLIQKKDVLTQHFQDLASLFHRPKAT